MSAKYRVLIAADVPFWAYHHRLRGLCDNAPADFDVIPCYHSNSQEHSFRNYDIGDFDLFFNLCYFTRGFDRQIKKRGLNTVLVVSHNRDPQSKLEVFKDSYEPANNCGFLIINNQKCFEHHGRLPRTCNISNGVRDVYHQTVPMECRDKKVIWFGSSNPKKGKRFQSHLIPLGARLRDLGFECDFRPIDHVPKPEEIDQQNVVWRHERQNEWYNSAAITVCASESEGTPNAILESVSTGCVPVTTSVGNVPEFAVHDQNAVIVSNPPTVDELVDACQYAWEHRERLSAAAVETMRGWTYGEPGNRARYFWQLFRRLIEDGPNSIEPFSYFEKRPEEI